MKDKQQGTGQKSREKAAKNQGTEYKRNVAKSFQKHAWKVARNKE